jgi:hypothetical protein
MGHCTVSPRPWLEKEANAIDSSVERLAQLSHRSSRDDIVICTRVYPKKYERRHKDHLRKPQASNARKFNHAGLGLLAEPGQACLVYTFND